jgi:hypothetical protein
LVALGAAGAAEGAVAEGVGFTSEVAGLAVVAVGRSTAMGWRTQAVVPSTVKQQRDKRSNDNGGDLWAETRPGWHYTLVARLLSSASREIA